MNKIEETLSRGVAQILPDRKALSDLMTKRRIRLYQGFDPSMPSLHLGNFVGLMKLRQFQKLGHEVIFLIGDFTGMIGDPTDKLATRPKLTREQVLQNTESWKKQVSMVLNLDGENPAKIMFNSKWSDKINFKDLIEITSNFTVSQMLERDMFQERLKKNEPIFLHEFLYPVAQAQDSVEMDVDLEVGGNDQLFNMMAGRNLMRMVKNKEKFVLTTKLLVDKDGKKAGKTTGNALFLDSSPENFYGGIMSFPDEVIYLSYELLTELPLSGLEEKIKGNPMKEKKRLAFEIVKLLWGEKIALDAQSSFEDTFQKKEIPKDAGVEKPGTVREVVSRTVGSNSEAKRLISQNAIEINGKVVGDPNLVLSGGETVKIGKKKFIRIGD